MRPGLVPRSVRMRASRRAWARPLGGAILLAATSRRARGGFPRRTLLVNILGCFATRGGWERSASSVRTSSGRATFARSVGLLGRFTAVSSLTGRRDDGLRRTPGILIGDADREARSRSGARADGAAVGPRGERRLRRRRPATPRAAGMRPSDRVPREVPLVVETEAGGKVRGSPPRPSRPGRRLPRTRSSRCRAREGARFSRRRDGCAWFRVDDEHVARGVEARGRSERSPAASAGPPSPRIGVPPPPTVVRIPVFTSRRRTRVPRVDEEDVARGVEAGEAGWPISSARPGPPSPEGHVRPRGDSIRPVATSRRRTRVVHRVR